MARRSVFQVFSNILSETQLGQPIALVVIKDPQINAFAVPGGLFALNTGLISSARNIDEIAGVMAHEIAHVSQRHFSRSEEAFKGQTLLKAGLLAGVALAAQAGGDAGAAVMLGTQAALLISSSLIVVIKSVKQTGMVCNICMPLVIIRKAWRIILKRCIERRAE